AGSVDGFARRTELEVERGAARSARIATRGVVMSASDALASENFGSHSASHHLQGPRRASVRAADARACAIFNDVERRGAAPSIRTCAIASLGRFAMIVERNLREQQWLIGTNCSQPPAL